VKACAHFIFCDNVSVCSAGLLMFKVVMLKLNFVHFLQYILPAVIHIRNQPPLQRGDGPIVSGAF
jgi:hypothetical protein